MRIAYLGNFLPGIADPWSTEHHLRLSLEELGHEVTPIQEGEVKAVDVPNAVYGHDLFIWTQTYGLAVTGGEPWERQLMVERISEAGITSVAVHLDRYWGLEREDQIGQEPWWKCDWVFSADGGHQPEFHGAGIRHSWFQPGVLARECVDVSVRGRFPYRAPIAFVGSYNYHPAWSYRPQLIDWLRKTYRSSFRLWPRQRQIRGLELNGLYQSATVVVGDSCLVPNADGSPVTHYWSDRIPETLGRGGFLIHPWVEGIEDHYVDGEHLRLYQLGDFEQLQYLIDYYLGHPGLAREVAAAGQEHVRAHHTYTHRMADVLATVAASA